MLAAHPLSILRFNVTPISHYVATRQYYGARRTVNPVHQ